MSSFLAREIDYAAHNEEVRRVMAAFDAGKPERVPLVVIGSITNFFMNPDLNTQGWTFQQYFEDPDIQIKAQLEFVKWERFNLLCDREMGIPETGWPTRVDFQNCYDAGWYGAPLKYLPGQVPDTEEILRDDKDKQI